MIGTTSTVEDYLKCILLAEQGEAGALVTMGQIGSALGVAPGTVTSMMKTLAEASLVRYEPYSGVSLTDAGRKLAAHVLRRHRLIELFLVEVMQLDWSEVHDEAERLEHAVSDLLIERIDEMLGHPSVDPHGDPIPSPQGDLEAQVDPNLLHCSLSQPLTVVRVGDQSADFLRLMERGGLTPGSTVTVASRDETADAVILEVDGKLISLGFRAASKVFVRAEG